MDINGIAHIQLTGLEVDHVPGKGSLDPSIALPIRQLT